MSLLGLTIDYGPFAWMEHFDPDFICNHSDQDGGRYRYKAQGDICKWNLFKLSEALESILDTKVSRKLIEELYDETFEKVYNEKMA